MRSVNADETIYKKAADPEYRAKHSKASMVKKRIREMERDRKINPILDIILNNMKTKSTKQDKQHKEQVEEWRKLLTEKNPWIEEEKFVELFDMYDFDARKPEQETWFSFKISSRLTPGESQQKWKQEQEIFVILQKLYSRIKEVDMKILTTKLQNQKAVVITITNDNPLDFSYDIDKICLIDKDLLRSLLYYRIDAIKRYALYNDIIAKKKV